jgi:hypothetical protein
MKIMERAIKQGSCFAHNPNKRFYEVWQTEKGFYAQTDHFISGPFIATPVFATVEEAEAEYRRQAAISRSWKDGVFVGDPDDPDDPQA